MGAILVATNNQSEDISSGKTRRTEEKDQNTKIQQLENKIRKQH